MGSLNIDLPSINNPPIYALLAKMLTPLLTIPHTTGMPELVGCSPPPHFSASVWFHAIDSLSFPRNKMYFDTQEGRFLATEGLNNS